MKQTLFFGMSGALMLIFCSCINGSGTTESPVIPAIDSACGGKNSPPQVPPAEKDPENSKKAAVQKPQTPVPPVAVQKPQPPAPPVAKTAPAPEKPAAPVPACKPKHRRSPDDYRRGPGAWRAFTRLPREEQRKLLELQRTSPEEFRKILRNKADELYQQEAARRNEIDQLTEKIRKSKNPAETEKLKSILRAKLKEDFQLRLNDTRRDIEAYKRRTASLEAELQKREKNCDAIVEAILNQRLTGEKAFPPKRAKKK